MAVGLAPAYANKILDYLTAQGGGSNVPTAIGACWIKLHTGDPGAAGTSNAAGNTTRKQAVMSAASGGAITNSSSLEWTNVSTSEDYSHYSAWDASTAGNFLFSGTITANAVTAGDTFTIAAGDLDLSFGVAA